MEIGKLTNSIYSRANEDYSKFNNLSKILGNAPGPSAEG